jgi:hypothetical protein
MEMCDMGEPLQFASIADVATPESGGGIALDLIALKDGRVLAVSDESVVLYDNVEDRQCGSGATNRPTLPLV